MAIIRVNKNKNYTIMSNYHFKDKSLSLKGKGLLSQMLSLPNDWDYSVEGLVAINKESKTAIQNALKELEEYGYLVRTKTHDKNGRIDYVYDVYEEPHKETPQTENPVTVNPCTGNMPQLNTKESITKELNTKELNTKESKKEESNNTQNQQVEMSEELRQMQNEIEQLKAENEKLKAKKAKPKRQAKSYDEQIAEYTGNAELQEALKAFVQMRAFIKKPLTEYGLKLLLSKLSKIGRTDAEKIAIVNRSVEHNWQGFFEIKEESSYQKPVQPENVTTDKIDYSLPQEFLDLLKQ